jgi:hypothetical protein
MDAINMDDLLNDDDYDENDVQQQQQQGGSSGKAGPIAAKNTRRHSLASFAPHQPQQQHEGGSTMTMDFSAGSVGMRTHFNDDGNTQMTALSSASITSMAPSELLGDDTTAHTAPTVSSSAGVNTRRMTADAADMPSFSRVHDDSEYKTEPVQSRRRQTMVVGRDLELPSPSPLKPRKAQSLAPGELMPANSGSSSNSNSIQQEQEEQDRTEENFTAHTEGSAAFGAAYRPKSALKGGRQSLSAIGGAGLGGGDGHTVEFDATTAINDNTTNTRASMGGSSKFVVFGSPKAAEFDKEMPTNALTPMDKSEAKARFSMTGSRIPTPVDDDDDELTEQNSEILEQWDRLTNDGSGSDSDNDNDNNNNNNNNNNNSEQEDASGPLPSLGAARRSSIGFSSRRNSLGGSGSSNPADLLHFDNTEELTAHSVIGRFSMGGNGNTIGDDKTMELEPDLMSMLESYDARAGQREQEKANAAEEASIDVSTHNDEMEEAAGASNEVQKHEQEQQQQEEEGADSDASTQEDMDRSATETSMSLSLMMNDSMVSASGGNRGDRASILERLKNLNNSSRRNTLSHAGSTPTGSRMSLNKRRQSQQQGMTSTSRVLKMNAAAPAAPGDDNLTSDFTCTVQQSAVERQVSASRPGNDDSFIGDAQASPIMPPVPASPVHTITSSSSSSKRATRSNPTSPATPLSQQKEVKRSRRKSPAKRMPLVSLLAACGLGGGEDSSSSSSSSYSSSASITRAVSQVPHLCTCQPALNTVMEAVLKHTAEATAIAQGSVAELWSGVESRYDSSEVPSSAATMSGDVLEALGETALVRARNELAKEESRVMEVIARQLEKKAKEVRHKAKAIRRASTAVISRAVNHRAGAEAEAAAGKEKAEELTAVQAEVHLARKRIEEVSAEIEALSDETSAALEKQKQQLVSFTQEYSQKTNAEQVVVDRVHELESQLSAAESDVCDTRTKIGVMQSITHHKLCSFKVSQISFDCVLSAGIKAVVDFHVKNSGKQEGYQVSEMVPHVERSGIHGVGLCSGSDNIVSENMAAQLFHSIVFCDKDGPLSPAAMADMAGQPFQVVHNTVQVFAGYISAFRLVMSKLSLFTADGWNWTLQNRDVVLFSPDDRFKLTISMEILISGNIAALSAQCLRNRDDRPVAELPIKAVLASLRAKYGGGGSLGNFCAAALKRELDSILKYL